MNRDKLNDLDRRTFIKGTAVATTGIGAFGGQAAAQQRQRVNVDASQLQVSQQTASGLINVQVSNLNVQDVVDIRIGRDVVNLQNADIDILSNNNINIVVQDAIDIVGNQVQVAVTVLGETVQGQQQEVQATGTDVVEVVQSV